MTNLKFVAYFAAIGFASDALLRYMGVRAMPQPLPDVQALEYPKMDMFYKGVHFDNVTGNYFDLFTVDNSLSDAAALERYFSAFAGEDATSLAKRDWYDCEFPRHNYIQKFGCNSAHAIGKFVSATGAAAAGGYITGLMKEAFNGSRDNQKPRSVCLSRDNDTVCVSWAEYSTDVSTSGENTDVANDAVKCGQANGSAEFQTTTTGGGTLYICVSNRATGCGNGIGC